MRLKFSTIFYAIWYLDHAPIDIQVKNYGDRPRGTPPSGELNTRRVAECSDFGPIDLGNGAINILGAKVTFDHL